MPMGAAAGIAQQAIARSSVVAIDARGSGAEKNSSSSNILFTQLI
jgi:hypothetical protein